MVVITSVGRGWNLDGSGGTVHPPLLGELVQERIDDLRPEAAAQRALAEFRSEATPRPPWRVELGVRLIAWGCRLWLSGHREGSGGPAPTENSLRY